MSQDKFTGEIKAWHSCGCVDLELPGGRKKTLYCKQHSKNNQVPQKGVLKLSFNKPVKLSEDDYL